jgi:putative nucleotidyltransferase with HDIG domain
MVISMNIGGSVFQSKVAQRIFVLFICCAMFPLGVMALLSFNQVSNQLKEQSVEQLRKAAKAHGVSIFERLLLSETDLHLMASVILQNAKEGKVTALSEKSDNALVQRFKFVGLITPQGDIIPVYGNLNVPPEVQKPAVTQNDDKITAIFVQHTADSPARVFMTIPLNPGSTESKRLLGEIDTVYLWGIGHENVLPPMTDLCIIDPYRKVLVSSFPVSSDLLHHVSFGDENANTYWFDYTADKDSYVVSYWPLFLKSRFISDNMTIILRRAKADVLAPLSHFTKVFPFVILLSLWIVLLLSIVYIRRSLVPLEKLKTGTLNVASRHFDRHVHITSGDEFEDLAKSFNWMTDQLDRHFNALLARSEIDRAILSSFRTKKIIDTALNRFCTFFQCDTVSIGLLRNKQPDALRSYRSSCGTERKFVEEFLRISNKEAEMLPETLNHMIIDLRKSRPSYVSPTVVESMHTCLVLPLFIGNALIGIINIFHIDEKTYSEDDLNHARQLANQITVALSNAFLIEDLENLNWGTLEALARTVDAKSRWTAGHSERVADLSVKIGQVLGYNQKEAEALQRAAFLHDIGKIGVPLAILDKPGALDAKEYEVVKEHPAIGAKILEPIEAYADIIPIVMQHHERFNGKGYPKGLSGEDIVLGARILAVADVFDAVASDRPYRQGWVEEKAIALITGNAGKDFDPQVVAAFLATRV